MPVRVTKRLAPGLHGTKHFQAEYGKDLGCVRYRQDDRRCYTTVELLVDRDALPPPSLSLKDIVY
ncbi:MAG: hypothetical protein H6935_00680 [Thiobacillus sp.]|nr:hypothetical protein [Thiobacillus sp.]